MRVRRLAAKDDTAAAAKLLVRFFGEEEFDTPANVVTRRAAEMASLDACGLFVAETETGTIGVATVSLEFGIEFGWSAEMGDLYVAPEWRGGGVGGRLIAAIEKFLKGRGGAGKQGDGNPVGQDRPHFP